MKFSTVLSAVVLLATGALAKPTLNLVRNPLLGRQASAGDEACATGCTSASDEALLQQITACNIPDWSCFCSAWDQLLQDPSCATCLGFIDQTGQIGAMCSSGGIGATGAGSSTAAAPDSTATSPAQICASSCSSSDQTALAQLGTTACAESATCVCTTLEGLSSSCQTCVLNTEFLTPADLQNECAPVLSNSGSAGAATGSPTQGAGSSAGAGGTTPTSAAGGSGGSGGSGASNSASGAAAASSSPAAPKSGALPSVDLRLAMVVLGGMLAGGMLLL